MMPKHSVYGQWPRSGEIDVLEATGNLEMYHGDSDVLIGPQMVLSTVMFGPDRIQNGFEETLVYTHKTGGGYHEDFHTWKMEWTNEKIEFYIDNELTNRISPGKNGMFELGKLSGVNPWLGREVMAPFDQEFYVIMNLAIGGDMFPNNVTNKAYPKPFNQEYPPRMAREFWEAKKLWEPTWHNENSESHFQVDFVKIWAV